MAVPWLESGVEDQPLYVSTEEPWQAPVPGGVRKQGTLNPEKPLKQNEEVAKLKWHEGVGKAERQ